jgi:SAM-dependent MidA family methyltransferase
MTDAGSLHEGAQAARVRAHLGALIDAAGGFLSFDRYMDAALYAPGLGYYSAGAHKLGRGGDFTTAPEISSLFGRCVAAQCAPLLRVMPQARILELGPGSGRLAADVLAELAVLDALPAQYALLEVSPDLRARQRERLSALPAALASRVVFLDAPPAEGWQGVLLANEVLDALPCEAFGLRAAGPVERGVGRDADGRFDWRERPAPGALARELQRVLAGLPEPLEPGYDAELCLRTAPWIAGVTATLERGVALFIDYGLPRAQYFHPTRSTGTLRCHYRQTAHGDPFAHPGLEDLTAWVDFTRVAEAADDCGLDVLGFTSQAAFLLGTGIEALLAAAPDDVTRARRVSEARQLLLPDAMGEAFKVMALGRGWDAPLAGFAHQDLLSRL